MKYLFLLLLLASCGADHGKVVSILEQEGCTDIVEKGPDYFFSGCSDKDFFNNQFSCKKNDRAVEGVVCSGLFKGYTVRYH